MNHNLNENKKNNINDKQLINIQDTTLNTYYKDKELYQNKDIKTILYKYQLSNNKYERLYVSDNQKFKYLFSIDFFIHFLNINCVYTESNMKNSITSEKDYYYTFNKDAYKRSILNNTLEYFLNILVEFYHKSKLMYVKECKTYNKFLTLIRHICKLHNLQIDKKTKYFKSDSVIYYHIFYS
jgi:hypothetical protein